MRKSFKQILLPLDDLAKARIESRSSPGLDEQHQQLHSPVPRQSPGTSDKSAGWDAKSQSPDEAFRPSPLQVHPPLHRVAYDFQPSSLRVPCRPLPDDHRGGTMEPCRRGPHRFGLRSPPAILPIAPPARTNSLAEHPRSSSTLPRAIATATFLEGSYRAILANPAWAARLKKAHTSKRQARPTGPPTRSSEPGASSTAPTAPTPC